MKRLIISFFITLLLYIVLFFIIKIDLQRAIKLPPKKRFSISTLRLIKQPKPSKPIPSPSTITPPTHKKPSIHKKQKPQKHLPKAFPKKHQKLAKKRRNKKTKIAKKRAFHKVIKEKNSTKPIPVPLPSLNTLFAKKPPTNQTKPPPKEIQKLYKDEFSTFTKEQQKFIKNNLAKIAAITQKYLYLGGYPYIAVKTRQEGVNIVEFYLHPNGDITDLKLIKSSGYEALDTNSIETIKAAYKDYPLPQQTTKIRIYIHYTIIY